MFGCKSSLMYKLLVRAALKVKTRILTRSLTLESKATELSTVWHLSKTEQPVDVPVFTAVTGGNATRVISQLDH